MQWFLSFLIDDSSAEWTNKLNDVVTDSILMLLRVWWLDFPVLDDLLSLVGHVTLSFTNIDDLI